MDGKYSGVLETVYKGLRNLAFITLTALPGCVISQPEDVTKVDDVPHARHLRVEGKSITPYKAFDMEHGFFDGKASYIEFNGFEDGNKDGKWNLGERGYALRVVPGVFRESDFDAFQRGLGRSTFVKVKVGAGSPSENTLQVSPEDVVTVRKGGK